MAIPCTPPVSSVRVQPFSRLRILPGTVILVLTCLLNSCSGSIEGGKPPPARQVSILNVTTEPVTLDTELAGRAVASEEAEIRPQVDGILLQRLFEEGSDVRAGQPLFRIDPTLYEAAVRQAQANLGNTEAALVAARLKAERYRTLAAGQLLSQQDTDDAEASFRQAEASRDAAAAALETARTNLRFATVSAPISGRIGRMLVTPGALVTAGQSTALAKVQKLDPMFVNLTQSDTQYLALRRALADGGMMPASTEVKIRLADGTDYPLPGRLEFADIDVAESTGTVTLRVQVPNPARQLLPGMYVRAVVEQGLRAGAVLVPQTAVNRTPRGLAQVWVIDPEGKARSRQVRTSRAIGDRWLIEDGLQAGDQVIVGGAQDLAEGTPVAIRDAAAPATKG